MYSSSRYSDDKQSNNETKSHYLSNIIENNPQAKSIIINEGSLNTTSQQNQQNIIDNISKMNQSNINRYNSINCKSQSNQFFSCP